MLHTIGLAILFLAGIGGAADALESGAPIIGFQPNGECRDLTVGGGPNQQVLSLGCLDVASRQFSMRPSTLYLGNAPGETVTYGSPTSGGLKPQLFSNRAAIGASTSTVNLNSIQVDQDQASVSKNGFVNYLNISGTMTQPTRGGRQGLQVLVHQMVPAAPDSANRNYVGAAFGFATFQGDGGSGLTPEKGARGAYFGINPYAVLGCQRAPKTNGAGDKGVCATNVLNLSGAEVNYAARAGTSVWYKSGIQIAALPDDVVSGAAYDAALSISNQGGVVGKWTDGILFSEANGSYAVNPDGWLLRSKATGLPSFSISARGLIKGDIYANGGIRPVQAAPDGTLSAPANLPPARSSAACTIGQTAWDAQFEYRCVETNHWRRRPVGDDF